MKIYTNMDVPFSLTLEEAAERLKVQEDFLDEFEDIFKECLEVAHPKYRFAEVEAHQEGKVTYIGGHAFDSRIMAVNLKGKTRAYPGVATCGRELYDLAQSKDDVLERFWVDGVSEMLLRYAHAALHEEIKKVSGAEGIRAMSPGSLADFPIIEQKKLFAMLDDTMETIGLELTPTCLMLPYKSGSSIYFESDEHYENCALCLREGCPNRRHEFDEAMFKEKFGLTEEDAVQKVGR